MTWHEVLATVALAGVVGFTIWAFWMIVLGAIWKRRSKP